MSAVAASCGCSWPVCDTIELERCVDLGYTDSYGTPQTGYQSETVGIYRAQDMGMTRDRADRDRVVRDVKFFVSGAVTSIDPRGRITWCGECYQIEEIKTFTRACRCPTDKVIDHHEVVGRFCAG